MNYPLKYWVSTNYPPSPKTRKPVIFHPQLIDRMTPPERFVAVLIYCDPSQVFY